MSRFLILIIGLMSPFISLSAGLFSNQPTFLPAQQAFVFSHHVNDKQLVLNWHIAEGYYLYQQSLSIEGAAIEANSFSLPPGELHHDEFFGEVAIYRHALAIPIPISHTASGTVTVRYQGCTKGFCYPPEEVNVELERVKQAEEHQEAPSHTATMFPEALPGNATQPLAAQLAQQPFSVLWFVVFGLGLAFTPCVLPMLPLLSAIVLGRAERPSQAKAVGLSLLYVQGMALTYTLLGLIVAAIGLPFQIALQSPPVLIGLSGLFAVLALSLFGLFELRLPHRWQQQLDRFSRQQEGGSWWGVFVMGMIAGLVASPCTSAPLSGALLYVAQSGDLWLGAVALYLLALGMGIPLVAMTLFGHRILPKSGEWLQHVKTCFGFVMLALPVFLLSRVFPESESYLWALLAMAWIAWLAGLHVGRGGLAFGLRLMCLLGFAVAAKPLTDLIWQNPMVSESKQTTVFIRVDSLAELQQQLDAAKGKKVMLDLYADWCVACKEFEKYTFAQPDVSKKLNDMVLLQIDMTRNSDENTAFMRHFHILGLPTILFFDEQGVELPSARLTGFLAAEPFLAWLNAL